MVGRRNASSQDATAARQRRRALRRKATQPERLMWAVVRDRRLGGLKFRRQHSIGRYIVDFFCAEKNVVIEVDGDYHDYVQEADLQRQRYLESQGFRVIRFTNEEVCRDYETVVEGLARTLAVELPS